MFGNYDDNGYMDDDATTTTEEQRRSRRQRRRSARLAEKRKRRANPHPHHDDQHHDATSDSSSSDEGYAHLEPPEGYYDGDYDNNCGTYGDDDDEEEEEEEDKDFADDGDKSRLLCWPYVNFGVVVLLAAFACLLSIVSYYYEWYSNYPPEAGVDSPPLPMPSVPVFHLVAAIVLAWVWCQIDPTEKSCTTCLVTFSLIVVYVPVIWYQLLQLEKLMDVAIEPLWWRFAQDAFVHVTSQLSFA